MEIREYAPIKRHIQVIEKYMPARKKIYFLQFPYVIFIFKKFSGLKINVVCSYEPIKSLKSPVFTPPLPNYLHGHICNDGISCMFNFDKLVKWFWESDFYVVGNSTMYSFLSGWQERGGFYRDKKSITQFQYFVPQCMRDGVRDNLKILELKNETKASIKSDI